MCGSDVVTSPDRPGGGDEAVGQSASLIWLIVGGNGASSVSASPRSYYRGKSGDKAHFRWKCEESRGCRPAASRQPIPGVDLFACYLCRKIRCASESSNAMMKGMRGKLGNGNVAEKSGHLCISCGIRVGIYKRDDWLQYGGAPGGCASICRRCGSFTPVDFLYHSVEERVCSGCNVRKRHTNSVQTGRCSASSDVRSSDL